MKIGGVVTWTSQSHGTWKKKTGTIIAIVRPGGDPFDALNEQADRQYRIPGGVFGMSRRQESYLVDVGGFLYWPNVKGLQLEEKL